MPSFAECSDCRGNASEPVKSPQVDTLYCIIPTDDHAQHEPSNVGRAQRLRMMFSRKTIHRIVNL
jgi:hypothetical protein